MKQKTAKTLLPYLSQSRPAMLTCHLCMQRCLRTIIGNNHFFSAFSRTSPLTTPSGQNFRRKYTSVSSQLTIHKSELPHPGAIYSNYQKALARRDRNHGSRNDLNPVSRDRDAWLNSRGIRPVHKQRKLKKESEIAREAAFLKDPLKLAEFVRKTLRQDDFENAQALVRAASKDVQCTVSWNHLIDWQLSKGRMNAAIKTYNEMKKRIQIPDAHTYTIIFRGCAEHAEADKALEKVLSIYQALLTDKSPVKPNTIHMNAVLTMCAKALNMEALFTISEQMPAKGIRSPNKHTYTIMLNAIRTYVTTDTGDLTPMQKRQNIQNAILDGRRLWNDVTKRWRQGDAMIDEELACAMGRLLLLGEDRDLDDIFSLVEQSMNIPRQIPRKLYTTLQIAQPQIQDPLATISVNGEETSIAESQHKDLSAESSLGQPQTDQFQLLEPSQAQARSPSTYAKPGRNALSLLLATLLPLRHKEAAVRYWDLFTREIGVHPDRENFAAYLRILRVHRASTDAMTLLQQVPPSELSPSLFRIAMSACERDKLSPHCFPNAGKILDIMMKAFPVPSVPVLQSYLEVAVASTPSLESIAFGDEIERSKRAQGRQILRALERLDPAFCNLRSLLAYGDPSFPELAVSEKIKIRDQVASLVQRMIGAYDLVMDRMLVERKDFKKLIGEKRKLAAFVTRTRHMKQLARDGKLRESEKIGISEDRPSSEDGQVARAEKNYETRRSRGEESQMSTVYDGEIRNDQLEDGVRFTIHR